MQHLGLTREDSLFVITSAGDSEFFSVQNVDVALIMLLRCSALRD